VTGTDPMAAAAAGVLDRFRRICCKRAFLRQQCPALRPGIAIVHYDVFAGRGRQSSR